MIQIIGVVSTLTLLLFTRFMFADAIGFYVYIIIFLIIIAFIALRKKIKINLIFNLEK